MSRNILRLTWHDFQIGVDRLYRSLKNVPNTGIYGAPRGGLPLAVTLSHYLETPLLLEPQDGCIWVDDIVETGKTVDSLQVIPAAKACWVTKNPRGDVLAAYVVFENPWIVFPWEDAEQAQQDMVDYYASRE